MCKLAYARAQNCLQKLNLVGAKDDKSQDGFGADPSDDSQVSKVRDPNQTCARLKSIRI